MAIRTAIGIWEGNLQEGEGTMELGSGTFKGLYSFSSRFESGQGTNPEELIAAAHAGCFSMALSNILAEAGFTPWRVATEAKVHLDRVGGGFKITKIELSTEAKVPGIDEEHFRQHAQEAGKNCPVSQALASVPITVEADLLELD